MSNGFATSYSLSGSTFKERAKVMAIKPGPSKDTCSHNYIRPAPPMLEQANNGSWRVWHNIHFGYEAPSKDPGRNNPRTFVCCKREERVDGAWRVVQTCPECAKNAQVEQDRKMAEADIHAQVNAYVKAGGQVTDAQIKEAVAARCKPYVDYQKRHNLQRGWWINGWSPDTNAPVRCRLNDKACKKMIELLEEYRRRGIDGLALDQGLLFDVRRYGNGFGKEDEVVVVTEEETINGQKIPMPKRFPLTPEMQQRLLAECQDLGDPSPSVYLSPEQVTELVRMGDQDPEAVDRFFKRTQTERRGDGGSAPRSTNPLMPAAPVVADRIPTPPTLPQQFTPAPTTQLPGPMYAPAPVTYQANLFPQVTMGNPPPPNFIQGDQNPFARATAAPNFRPGEPVGDQIPEFAKPAEHPPTFGGFGATAPATPVLTQQKWTKEELMKRLNLQPSTESPPQAVSPAELAEQLLKGK